MIYITFHSNDPIYFSIVLEEKLEKLRVENNVGSLTELIKDLHIYPDFHGNTMLSFLITMRKLIDDFRFSGNRSPIADPRMQGSIVGLSLVSFLLFILIFKPFLLPPFSSYRIHL